MQMQNNLPIPKELTALIAEGFWPKDAETARQQNLRPLIPESVIRKFAPEESKIFFYPPPFSTVQAFMKGNKSFWSKFGATEEIDINQTLIIGDFGPGSDTGIALDYRKSKSEPSVIRLHWAEEGNHWIQVAPNFATFATYIKSDFIPPSAG
jgi:hypothetical protein